MDTTASEWRQCLYDAFQEAEREWHEFKATGRDHSGGRTFAGCARYETGAGRAHRQRERELFDQVEAARKAWLNSWATPHHQTAH
jgi:hypothetical protein